MLYGYLGLLASNACTYVHCLRCVHAAFCMHCLFSLMHVYKLYFAMYIIHIIYIYIYIHVSIEACFHVNLLLHRFGPLSKLWCMRFEAKHKQFKQICKRTSFKNIFKTLTESHQRRQAYDIHCSEMFSKVNMDTGVGGFTLCTLAVPSNTSAEQ